MKAEDQKKLLSFMTKKKDCLATILKMTEERKFRPVEEDVERFENFFHKRELLFENCKVLDKKIKEFIILDEDKKSFFYREVEKTENETQEIIKRIISIDEKNRKIMNALLKLIKDNLRNMKMTKQVKQSYDEFYFGESYGGFDSKK